MKKRRPGEGERGDGMSDSDFALRLASSAELQEMVQTLTRERDEARRQVEVLTEGLRLVSGALARLNQIYRADTDLGDPPVETPMWLQEAQHRAAALVGEGEAKECWCQWEAGDSPCPTHGMDEEKGGRDE